MAQARRVKRNQTKPDQKPEPKAVEVHTVPICICISILATTFNDRTKLKLCTALEKYENARGLGFWAY